MRKRAWFVARSAGAGGALWFVLVACGSSDGSSFPNGRDDGGPFGDDGGTFGDDGSSGGDGSAASGAPITCVVGTRGCLCDSTGGCAPPLTCTPQAAPRPNLCCNGTDCSSASGGAIGKTCGTPSGAPSCTPGITVPAPSGTNDGCGYPSTDFAESAVVCGINAVGGGSSPAIIQVFYNDEHALPLGCGTSTFPVSPLTSDPQALHYPQTGDPACVDSFGRPLRPVLFITDISADSSCTAGDMQKGGPAYDPVAVFGSWKTAGEGPNNVGTPQGGDPATNNWNLTTSADPVPASAMSKCTQGYGTELRFEVGLISGHSYRIQVISHDGDQTRGGDSGEACAVFCAGSGSLCDPGVTQCDKGQACPSGTSCVQGCCLSNVR